MIIDLADSSVSNYQTFNVLLSRNLRVNSASHGSGLNRQKITGVLLLSLMLIAGCQDPPGPKMKPVVPVSGKVQVKDQPAAGAMVMFHPLPIQPGRFDMIRSRGTVTADGTFQLTTYNTNDGAPEGEYAVTVYWPGKRVGPPDPNDEISDLPPDQLGLRYSDPARTPLRATVAAPNAQLNPFELK